MHGELNSGASLNLLSLHNTHTHLDYLLQAAPISFLQHPDSVQTTSGSDVNFTCISNVSVDPLWPYQPEYFPKLFWRFNGTSLNVSDMGEVVRYPAHWVINSTENISHLRVSNVSDSDMGYYECVVGDGLHTRGNGFAYVTVSKRAWLNVVGKLQVDSLKLNSHWLSV